MNTNLASDPRFSQNHRFVNHKPLTSVKMVCKRSPVGAPGIEPGTSCTPCKRVSRTAPRPVRQGGIIVAIGILGNEPAFDCFFAVQYRR